MTKFFRYRGEQLIFELPNKLGVIVLGIDNVESDKVTFNMDMPRNVRWYTEEMYARRLAALEDEKRLDAAVESICSNVDLTNYKAKAWTMD